MGPADLAGAAALGGILVWAVGYWSRIPGQIIYDWQDQETHIRANREFREQLREEKDTFEWYAEASTHALFKQVESKDGQTKGTDLKGDEMGDLETGPAKWEGSE